jgi:hypothetical protein
MLRYIAKIAQLSVLMLLVTTAIAAESEYGVLKYANGSQFQTGIYKPKLIAQLPVAGKEPFLVFSGRGCEECDANTSIYIHSPANGPMQGRELDPRYTYPGNYFDYETGQLVERVRMFVGQCFRPTESVAIWFSNSKLENGKWERSVFLVQIEDGQLIARLAPKPFPTVAAVGAAVSAGTCREVQGKRKVFTEP